MTVPFYGFEAIGRLWLLLIIPILIALYVIVVRRRAKRGMRYTNTTVLGAVMPVQSQWLRHVIVALSVLSLIALNLAWARPLGIDKVARERATIVLIIDISQSMMATDVEPNRLEAAKAAALNFVAEIPDGFNIGIVSLSGTPSVRLAPNSNKQAVRRVIESLVTQDGTAIGDALQAALSAVAGMPEGDKDKVPAMIVLLSDGGHTHGQSPRQAASQAEIAGIPIYTIAYGSDNGYVDLDDERINVPPDRELMAEIAEISGGEYYTADNARQLGRAYGRIQSELGWEMVEKEVTATWAFGSLIFALIAGAGAVVLGVRFK
ncbi:MAG: VWA domain-containing protein [Propionibacteriaceae bacterium]|jgi:Ca-activated chloride channel family protein|nr:VWA domain-containing protein [Propionibacteriaceae bacterium]